MPISDSRVQFAKLVEVFPDWSAVSYVNLEVKFSFKRTIELEFTRFIVLLILPLLC